MLRAALTVPLLICLTAFLATGGRSQTIDADIWARFLEARDMYAQHCAPCHGLEGAAGLTPYAPGFALGEGLDAEFGQLLLTIQEGTGGFMPPWESILSFEEQDWILFYALVLQGDNVFRKQCATCHERSVPRLPATIPRGEDLATYGGPIHVTRGTDVARTWSGQDQGHVIRMLRALVEER